MKQLIALFITVCTVAGCATGTVYFKAYPGGDLPSSQLALLKPASGITILSLDGDSTQPLSATQSFGNTDYEIALLPGRHTVVVDYNIGTAFSKSTQSRTFTVEAGRRYLLRANARNLLWNASIIDVTERNECWTVLADTLFGKCK
jgi:hypothetical protein